MNQWTLSSSQPNGFQIWSLRLRCAPSCARTQPSSGSDKSEGRYMRGRNSPSINGSRSLSQIYFPSLAGTASRTSRRRRSQLKNA